MVLSHLHSACLYSRFWLPPACTKFSCLFLSLSGFWTAVWILFSAHLSLSPYIWSHMYLHLPLLCLPAAACHTMPVLVLFPACHILSAGRRKFRRHLHAALPPAHLFYCAVPPRTVYPPAATARCAACTHAPRLRRSVTARTIPAAAATAATAMPHLRAARCCRLLHAIACAPCLPRLRTAHRAAPHCAARLRTVVGCTCFCLGALPLLTSSTAYLPVRSLLPLHHCSCT